MSLENFSINELVYVKDEGYWISGLILGIKIGDDILISNDEVREYLESNKQITGLIIYLFEKDENKTFTNPNDIKKISTEEEEFLVSGDIKRLSSQEVNKIDIDENPFLNLNCFDLILQGEENNKEYLEQEEDNILIIKRSGDTFYIDCFSRDYIRNILKDNTKARLFCELYNQNTGVKLGKSVLNVEGFANPKYRFYKLDTSFGSFYFSEKDVREMLKLGARIFYIKPEKEVFLPRVASLDVLKGGSVISADHCQEGTGIDVYKLEVCQGDNCLPHIILEEEEEEEEEIEEVDDNLMNIYSESEEEKEYDDRNMFDDEDLEEDPEMFLILPDEIKSVRKFRVAKWFYSNGRKIQENWYKNNKLSRKKFPAKILYYKNGSKKGEIWYKEDNIHRLRNLPAISRYYKNGSINLQQWLVNGKLHRMGAMSPASIKFYKNGVKKIEKWYRNGKLYREANLPSKISYHSNGNKKKEEWYKNGKLHRDGVLPAVIEYNKNGQKISEQFFRNGNEFIPTSSRR